MPVPLSRNLSVEELHWALSPLIDAAINLSIGYKVFGFAKTVFGVEASSDLRAEREMEMKSDRVVNGSFGESGACTSLMRTYVWLQHLGEDANAAELKQLAETHFPRDIVAQELARVRGGF